MQRIKNKVQNLQYEYRIRQNKKIKQFSELRNIRSELQEKSQHCQIKKSKLPFYLFYSVAEMGIYTLANAMLCVFLFTYTNTNIICGISWHAIKCFFLSLQALLYFFVTSFEKKLQSTIKAHLSVSQRPLFINLVGNCVCVTRGSLGGPQF